MPAPALFGFEVRQAFQVSADTMPPIFAIPYAPLPAMIAAAHYATPGAVFIYFSRYTSRHFAIASDTPVSPLPGLPADSFLAIIGHYFRL